MLAVLNVVLVFIKKAFSAPGCFARHLTINKTIASEGQSQMTVSVTSGDGEDRHSLQAHSHK